MNIVEILKNGGVGVLPTDTLYGLVGCAFNPSAVERIRNLKGRSADKPFITLISKIEDLGLFGVTLSDEEKNILNKVWPGSVSVELSVSDDHFRYLTRGLGHFAFRFPSNEKLLEIISVTGPLVAPSVNLEGGKPAETIEEAKKYFLDLDFYVDAGRRESLPSTLIRIQGEKVEIVRQGVVQIPTELL